MATRIIVEVVGGVVIAVHSSDKEGVVSVLDYDELNIEHPPSLDVDVATWEAEIKELHGVW